MRALLAVGLLLAVAGSAAASNRPLFRRADGTAIVFPRIVRAWCDRKNLHVLTIGRLQQSRWQLEVARKHVRSGRVVRFSWRNANGIGVFVFDATTRNEASEGAEGTRGVVSVRHATCRRGGRLEIGLSGTIASEFSDGKPVRSAGTYRGKVGSRPY
ncbi:MAG: hypothetical protein ACJ75G_11960 [Gaiellaceae bacterium]